MSRYYRIEVTPGSNGVSTSTVAKSVWTNRINGRASLGAQQVELDVWEYALDTPIGAGAVTIWGPSRDQISQASDYNGASISVYAGMQNGLPLASAAVANGQQGLILTGQVFQAFGNWQGINQTLNFVVTPYAGATQTEPANITASWAQGVPMATMIQTVLQQAFPGKSVTINISPALILSQTDGFVYQTMQQFSGYVRDVSKQIINDPAYPGVSIVPRDGGFVVFDSTMGDVSTKTTTIRVQDMIGAVTWLNANEIQFNTVMRADLKVGSIIEFQKINGQSLAGLTAITNTQSQSNARARNTFDGTWTVKVCRHIGNSRAPDAQSWISTFQAYSNTTL